MTVTRKGPGRDTASIVRRLREDAAQSRPLISLSDIGRREKPSDRPSDDRTHPQPCSIAPLPVSGRAACPRFRDSIPEASDERQGRRPRTWSISSRSPQQTPAILQTAYPSKAAVAVQHLLFLWTPPILRQCARLLARSVRALSILPHFPFLRWCCWHNHHSGGGAGRHATQSVTARVCSKDTWWLAKDLLDVAGLPVTKKSIHRMAKENGWRALETEAGRAYHIDSFPLPVRKELMRRRRISRSLTRFHRERGAE